MAKLFKTSVARKVAMALSALFLILFLVIHFAVNITSVFSSDLFNELSHFMGTNPLIQGLLQPILMAGVVFHFVVGFILEMQNRKARGNQKYVQYNGGANSTWMSRNMIYSGVFILAFLAIHLKDFWLHEMTVKYINGDTSGLLESGQYRYFSELQEHMSSPLTVILYCIGFIALGLHLIHGFQSAFQSMGLKGADTKKCINTAGKVYTYVICGGFIFIALFHYIHHLLA